ncbi:hypothetical protein R0290_10660 [Burkholderia semiarida]|uniref:hypothetical protein n=1 Tax=Burkholderia TaxID=32008 RepID=UPI000F5F552D|nr:MULTISPECIES: hypothetical protein [Burkholderia]MDN7699575.1 hypothetical protein [Burkholderia sp. AU44665]
MLLEIINHGSVRLQMRPESRANAYAIMGLGSTLLGSYALERAIAYFGITGDSVGGIAFGGAGICLFVVAVAHFYMAIGYRFGRLEAVEGSPESATLKAEVGVVAKAVKIRFLRRPDARNSISEQGTRYIFFIGNGRPWVCPESRFLMD